MISLGVNENVGGEVYNPTTHGYIVAIRLYIAEGTTRAKIKTETDEFLVDWHNESQRELFVKGIDAETLFYDERHKPMFHEI